MPAIIAAVAFYFVINYMVTAELTTAAGIVITAMDLFYAALVGLVLTVVIVVITEYYTGIYAPVKRIAEASHHRSRYEHYRWSGLSVFSQLPLRFWPSVPLSTLLMILPHFTASPLPRFPCCQ